MRKGCSSMRAAPALPAALVLALLWCALPDAVPAAAVAPDLRLEAPRRVARGDAFVVTARSAAPAEHIAFHWKGRKLSVPARREDGAWVAEILLAVPLEGGEKSRTLEAAAPGGGQARMAISLYDRNRPEQKLSVDRKYVEPPKKVLDRIRRDREKVGAVLASFAPDRRWNLPLLRPVDGGVSSLFGLKRVFNGKPRGWHRGLDLRSPQGTPIRACADGVVALAEDLYYAGNAVYLDHGLGVITAYMHMSEIRVRPGDVVRRGQTLGLVGATGRVTGPHLHLSLFAQGVSADIQPLLEAGEGGTKGGGHGRKKN